jgi:hypothetical protein
MLQSRGYQIVAAQHGAQALSKAESESPDLVIVIVNRAPSSTTPSKDMVEEFLQREIIVVIPPAPELAFQSAERGTPMVIMQPESLVSIQFHHLAQHIASRYDGPVAPLHPSLGRLTRRGPRPPGPPAAQCRLFPWHRSRFVRE